MKTLILGLSLLSLSNVYAEIDNCFKDAETHGNHWHAVSPSIDCAEAVKSHSEKTELTIPEMNLHVYGLRNMLFVEQAGKKELMAGDQTELKGILKFFTNKKKDKLVVLQRNSVSVFRLDFIGNVAPLKHFRSPIVIGAKEVRLLEDQNLLAIISPGSVRIINADAETRHKDPKFAPKLLHEIISDSIPSPSDVAVDEERKLIHVLNSERIFSFKMGKDKQDREIAVNSAPEAKSIEMREKKLFLIKKSGQQVEVTLTN